MVGWANVFWFAHHSMAYSTADLGTKRIDSIVFQKNIFISQMLSLFLGESLLTLAGEINYLNIYRQIIRLIPPSVVLTVNVVCRDFGFQRR